MQSNINKDKISAMMTPPGFYDANMALLKDYHPRIWQIITDTAPEAVGILYPAQNGSLNLTVTNKEGKEVSLHKKSDPESEADDFLANVPTNHTGFVAMLGMGLGYAPLGILEKRPLLQHLAVFELEPGIFLQALKHIDLSTLLSNRKLILGIGNEISVSEVLSPASRTLQLEGSNVFHHLPSFDFNPSGYQALKEQVFAHLNSLNVGGTTTRILGREFFNNRFKHITTIHHHLLLEQLRNEFADVPAILVAGGPSLDKNIHLLKQARDKAVILAVDTVLPALLDNGVFPHFITSIDPNNLTYEKFADVIPEVKNASLICSSWVNPKTPQNFPAQQIFWTFTVKPMEAWLNSLIGGKIFTGGASTVAHLNLIATDILGCDPIIFVGQDLAYPPQTASHAKGTVLQGSAPTDTLQPDNTEGQLVKGIDGTTLRTNRSFLSMKKFFESAIAQSNKKYINATEGGAHIEGTTPLSLQETLDTYCIKETAAGIRIQKQIKSAKEIDPHRLLNEFGNTLKKTKKLQKNIAEADKLCKSVQHELKKSAKNGRHVQSFNMLPSKIQQKIKEIDLLHKKLDNSGIWRVLEEITMDGLQKSERDRQAIATLENDPAKYSEWLKQNLIRLININKVRKETLNLLAENLNRILSFHQQENSFFSKINRGENKDQNRLKLARLYMEEGNYSLARPILEKLQKTMPQCGEIFFSMGCIEALHSEFEESAECFRKAVTIDSELSQDAKNFHKKLGDEFLAFAEYFKTQANRRPSVTYMVKKGLRFAPNHSHLLYELEKIIKKDIKLSQSSLDIGNNQDAAQSINSWYDFLVEQKDVTSNLNLELVSEIYLNHGRLLVKEKSYPEAVADFQKGLEFFPENYDLNRSLIDTLFNTGDFNGAIEALNGAIAIDSEFAGYWEIIGDSLQANGQNEDAILAYERCFTIQPENSNLVKKIGDCYMAAGQLEAAKEAYLQFKTKLQKFEAATDSVQYS